MSDLERELEEELHRVLDPIAARPIPPRRAVRGRRTLKTVLGGAGAALTIKVLTGGAVAAAAVTVAGAATTGSLNPVVWGQQVTQQVSSCKSKLAAGDHGIGDCVSQFASQHGAAVASAARHHGDGDGNGNPPDNGASNGNGSSSVIGHGKVHTRGQPTAAPTFDPEATDPVQGHAPVKVSPGS
jgi:hypothetical protein